MMVYEISWSDTSVRQLEKLDAKTAGRILKKIESIAENPFLFVKRLEGFPLFSLRIGDYRAVMSIENSRMVVFILEVGHRSVVYRGY